ncbi:unnamed protein product [Allacma fusca]|uniref:Uncharacterized protein n=1 Tax=Allacma fusca TaxID=39272 RepID=A0A8J2PA14_9HEXA|nr:unnamed protein product [Allacma fusca]
MLWSLRFTYISMTNSGIKQPNSMEVTEPENVHNQLNLDKFQHYGNMFLGNQQLFHRIIIPSSDLAFQFLSFQF